MGTREQYIAVAALLACVVTGFLIYDTSMPSRDVEAPAPATAFIENEPIQPLSTRTDLDPRRVALGKRIFSDPGLSGDGTISCAHCHNLAQGGADGMPRSIGVGGAVGEINSPTVLNAALNFRQFWDGRAATLEDQIDGPLHAPNEMNSSWPLAIEHLSKTPPYPEQFAQIYSDGITVPNAKNAIATFERSLARGDSRFDRYLRGERAVLTEDEIRGYELFKAYGCIACHQGSGIGGNMFQRLGVMRDFFADRGHVAKVDHGRFNVTGKEDDRHVFKVPSLRNVALTPPYFHDGSAPDLHSAVAVMATYQLGRRLSAEETDQIVKFLSALTSETFEVQG